MNKHNGNDLYIEIIAQAIEEMKEVQGESFSLENVNLAELERRTGITRARLRRMKANGFKSVPHVSYRSKGRLYRFERIHFYA